MTDTPTGPETQDQRPEPGSFAYLEWLRQTPQYRRAEIESAAPRMFPSEIRRDPETAARRIERLRELLAWFVLRYQIEKEPR